MDSEKAVYLLLAKAKENNVYENLSNFVTKVINLYIKRFGLKEYAESIPELEFSEQLIDCMNNLAVIDEDGKRLFEVFTDETEQCYIGGMISSLMLGKD